MGFVWSGTASCIIFMQEVMVRAMLWVLGLNSIIAERPSTLQFCVCAMVSMPQVPLVVGPCMCPWAATARHVDEVTFADSRTWNVSPLSTEGLGWAFPYPDSLAFWRSNSWCTSGPRVNNTVNLVAYQESKTGNWGMQKGSRPISGS